MVEGCQRQEYSVRENPAFRQSGDDEFGSLLRRASLRFDRPVNQSTQALWCFISERALLFTASTRRIGRESVLVSRNRNMLHKSALRRPER